MEKPPLFEIIKTEIAKLKGANRSPQAISYSELIGLSELETSELNTQLNNLYRIGMISVYQAINDKMIILRPPPNETNKQKTSTAK